MTVASECLPPEFDNIYDDDHVVGRYVFSPLPDPNDADFEERIRIEVSDIVRARQMHSEHHTPTCFKYGSGQCRLRFPRALIGESGIDAATGVIHIQRDHAWLNGFNPWISLSLRSNHDVQFLLTKDHAMAIMYYVVKYISKNEQSLHSKLAIAAAVRAAQTLDNKSNTAMGKQMIQKVYNKIESHREVGLPEAISHLLKFPDHYTDATFSNINTTHLLTYMKLQSISRDVHSHIAHDEARGSGGIENEKEGIDSEIIVSDRRYKIINIFDDYRYRGAELAAHCLYDYSAMYVKRKCKEGIPFTPDHPQREQYSQIERTNGYATPNLLGNIMHLNPRSSEKCEREDFYCIVVGLFVPWGILTPSKHVCLPVFYATSTMSTFSINQRKKVD
jgi:hypothetical protein